jgi:hypothetical protein
MLTILSGLPHHAGIHRIARDMGRRYVTGRTPAAACASPAPASSVAPGGTFFAITAVSPGDIWAVGTTSNAHNDLARTLAAHGDGRHWSVVPSRDIWAVGTVFNTNGQDQTLAEHWDGHRPGQRPLRRRGHLSPGR